MHKKIVTIGGGTGTFVVLSALKTLPNLELSALVTTADDGGSTGHLRDTYGFLPAGDARQALVALAEDGDILRDLFAYRFTKSDIAGHNLGNLFITALTDLLGSDEQALLEASRILRVQGSVIPVTDSPSILVAILSDGTRVETENKIDLKDAHRASISSLSYKTPAPLSRKARTALLEADYIVIGPGDLYTSSISALLPEGMKENIRESSAKYIYIGNLFTKMGQTNGYPLSKHIQELTLYTGREPDLVVVHEGQYSPEVLEAYKSEGDEPVINDLNGDPRVVMASLASVSVVPPLPNDPVARSLMRHDPRLLAKALMRIVS